MEKKWAAADDQLSASELDVVERRLSANGEMLHVAGSSLSAKIEQVAALAEAAVLHHLSP